MIKIQWNTWILALIATIIPMHAFAEVPSWQIVPAKSSIQFTATQNDAPVKGQFKMFSGEINFDPEKLNESNIKITIDISSLTDPYNQLVDTLKEKDWFDTKMFPKAVYTANKFVKTGDKTFTAQGSLTIRDKSQPVTLTFTQEEYSATLGRVKGSTTLKRLLFGVGQGEWANTKTISDDVLVDFVITATKK